MPLSIYQSLKYISFSSSNSCMLPFFSEVLQQQVLKYKEVFIETCRQVCYTSKSLLTSIQKTKMATMLSPI